MIDTDKYGMTNEELLERYSNLSVDDYKELLAEVKRLREAIADIATNMEAADASYMGGFIEDLWKVIE